MKILNWKFRLSWALAVICFIIVARPMYKISKIVATGEMMRRAPKPFYGYAPVKSPNNNPRLAELMKSKNGVGKMGLDFVNIYYPATRVFSGETPYSHRWDPIGRRPAYPPILTTIYRVILTPLNYGTALLAHNYLQILLLILALFIVVIKSYKLEYRHFFALIGVFLLFLFKTSVGLSWFERGQFSLYPLVSYVFLLLGMKDEKVSYFLTAGLFASFKWSAFPFLGMATLGFFVYRNREKLLTFDKSFTIYFFTIGVPIVLGLAIFPSMTLDYLKIIKTLTQIGGAAGISLAIFYPKVVVQLIPFIWLFAFTLFMKLDRGKAKSYGLELGFFPFLFSLAVLCSIADVWVYYHRLIPVLAFLPFFVCRYVLAKGGDRAFSFFTLGLALILLLFMTRVIDMPSMRSVKIYMIGGILFFIGPYLARKLSIALRP